MIDSVISASGLYFSFLDRHIPVLPCISADSMRPVSIFCFEATASLLNITSLSKIAQQNCVPMNANESLSSCPCQPRGEKTEK